MVTSEFSGSLRALFFLRFICLRSATFSFDGSSPRTNAVQMTCLVLYLSKLEINWLMGWGLDAQLIATTADDIIIHDVRSLEKCYVYVIFNSTTKFDMAKCRLDQIYGTWFTERWRWMLTSSVYFKYMKWRAQSKNMQACSGERNWLLHKISASIAKWNALFRGRRFLC